MHTKHSTKINENNDIFDKLLHNNVMVLRYTECWTVFRGWINSFGNRLTFESCKNVEGKFDFNSKSMSCSRCDKSSVELIVFVAKLQSNLMQSFCYLSLYLWILFQIFEKFSIYDNVQTEFAISWCHHQ